MELLKEYKLCFVCYFFVFLNVEILLKITCYTNQVVTDVTIVVQDICIRPISMCIIIVI